MDKILDANELGKAVRQFRRSRKLSQVEVARRSGRSRDVLYRLELGKDISVSALLDILAAMGAQVAIAPRALPTLEEMRERFAHDDDDAA